MFFIAAHSLQAKFVHTPPQPLPSSFWVWEFSLDLPKSFAESDTMRLAGDMQAVVMAGGKVITWSEWYFVPSSKTSIMKANVIILHYFKVQNIFCLQTKENKQNNFITTGLSNDRPDQWKSKMSPPCWRSSPRLVGGPITIVIFNKHWWWNDLGYDYDYDSILFGENGIILRFPLHMLQCNGFRDAIVIVQVISSTNILRCM